MSSLTRHILELPPSGLTVTSPNQSQLDIAWTRNPRAQYYRLYMDGSYIADVTNPNYGVAGLGSNETHFFEVASIGLADGLESARSGRVFGTTQTDSVAPGQPGVITFSNITSSGFTASWGAATDNVGVVGYEYSLNGAAYVSVGNTLSNVFTGLASVTAFTLAVRAFDGVGLRGTARTGNVTTLAATASTLQFDAGTITVAPGQTGDIVIPINFATAAVPAVMRFMIQADVFIDASNGTAKGVGFGAYDGTRQFSHVHAASFPTGFRLGGLFLDAIHDAANNGGQLGGRIVGKSLGSNSCTLHIDRPLGANDSMTIQWEATAGCNARVDWFEIPPGNYQATGPTGVTITLPFAPKGMEFHPSKSVYYGAGTPKHALTAADEGFVTAWHAQCIGFASFSGGTIQQGSIGGAVNHDGWHFNMAYRGCIAGPPRTDYNFLWPMGYVTAVSGNTVTLNFDSADNGGPYTIYGSPFIAYDCECYAGLTQINAGTGAVSGLTGAPFTPAASSFGAAPNIDQIWPIGSYPDPSILSIVGSENSSIGFAVNANGTLKQGGIAKYDQSSYSTIAQQRILNADIDVNGTGTSTAHDAKGISFTDAVIKGQQRTSQQNFAVNAAVAVTGFVSGGVAATQSQGSGKAGYMAFMHRGSAQSSAGVPDLGLNANLNGKAIFAAGTEWKRDISALPVAGNSATLITTNAGAFKMEGLGWQSGGSYAGIPYVVVDSRTQPLVDVVVGDYSSESTVCRAPIPPRYDIIESYPHTNVFPALPDGSDSHVIVVDRYLWMVYELNGTYRRGSDWYCRSMTVFDLDLGDEQLPYGWTSGDVGGLCIFQGLLRGEEFTADSINHSIRTTVNLNQGWFVKPAGHAAYNGTNTSFIPLGAKIRLRASYPETGNFPSSVAPITATHAKIIRAMKKYGICNADANGAGPTLWSQGDTSPIFSDYATSLAQLQLIQGSDFDVVQTPNPQYFYGDAFTYPTGAAPTVSLAASANSVTIGGSVTLTPTVSNAVRQSLAPLPGVLKPVAAYAASPVRDTWYTLQAVNKFGAAYAYQRVLVSNWTHRETAYDFYVSPTGSMSNAGTIGSPFSLDLFNGSYNPLIAGMTIGFLDGTYTVTGTARAADTTVNALYHIAGGAPGKPTILQAVNRRGAVIALGARTDPVFGSYYDGMSTGHVWYIGLEFTGTAALHAISHIEGSGEGSGYLIDDCKFAANFTYPVRLSTGPYSGAPYQHGVIKPYLRANEFPGAAGKALVLLGGTDDALISNSVLAGGASAMSESLGNNTGTVVVP